MNIQAVDSMLYFAVFLSITLRLGVSRFPYSGAGKPPMFGDYEAQRHWQEITINLPTQQWYKNSTKNDLLYWGLDYPPLTAYHSLLCGYVAKLVNPDWIALNTSRGYESYHHKIFMRSTVLVADIVCFYVPLLAYWLTVRKKLSARSKAIAVGMCLLYPGLILIDHGHFQYNCASLGLTLLGIVFLMQNHNFLSAVFFTLALHYKQMTLYFALPFFCCMMGRALMLPLVQHRIKRVLGLGVTVLFVSYVCWFPYASSLEDTMSVVHRLFPFDRGLYEDKVANFWCILSIFIKWKKLLSTSSLAVMSATFTFSAAFLSSLHLLRYPSNRNFLLSLVNCSLAFFLFSFQVHEKSILLPALPVLLLMESHLLPSVWFLYISSFSLVPLLAKDGLIIPFCALSCLFLLVAVRSSDYALISFRGERNIPTFCLWISVIASFILLICMYTVKPSIRYPHLHVLLNCIFSGGHFLAFSVYFNYLQIFNGDQEEEKYSNSKKNH